VNGICGCGLPACCCQPAVAGGFIYADLWGELSTHLAPQALFVQSSPVCEPLLQPFPFPSTLGEVTLHPLSQACMFIYSSHGKWAFPSLLWCFPPTTTFTSFPTPCCWACATTPAFSGQLVYLQLMWEVGLPPLPWSFPPTAAFKSLPAPDCWECAAAPAFFSQLVRDFPSPALWGSGHPALFAMCLYCSYCLLLCCSVSLFSLGEGQSVQGAMLIWPRDVCVITTYSLAHLVRIFPSRLAAGDWWWLGGPPGFSV
jgi:hypothetical protein